MIGCENRDLYASFKSAGTVFLNLMITGIYQISFLLSDSGIETDTSLKSAINPRASSYVIDIMLGKMFSRMPLVRLLASL